MVAVATAVIPVAMGAASATIIPAGGDAASMVFTAAGVAVGGIHRQPLP